MATFKNLKDLEKYLTKQIKDSLEKDVAEGTKEIMSKNVETEVYSKYFPTVYERREDNGGLSDTDNMKHSVSSSGNEVTLEVTNNTMSNDTYLPAGKSPFEIAGVVEYGHDAGYGSYDYVREGASYLNERRFLQKTRDDLEAGLGKELLKEALKKRGIKTE